MKASGKIGSSGVYMSDNVERRFEIEIYNTKIRMVYIVTTDV